MVVRAKMRCNSITLAKRSAINPVVRDALPPGGYNYGDAQEKAKELGVELNVTFDAPTVHLDAVMDDGCEENRAFWQATPNGRVDLSIDNPDAAETFELGQEYYVDFTPASVNEGGKGA